MPLTLVANWKMNGSGALVQEMAASIRSVASSSPVSKALNQKGIEVVLCPPFPYLASLRHHLADAPVSLGGQNSHWETQGAYTGEVSAPMLKDLGCRYVLVAHSERRQGFQETLEQISGKLYQSFSAGLTPILCIGETQEEHGQDLSADVLIRQLGSALDGLDQRPNAVDPTLTHPNRLCVAYEPIWAIGSGRTPNPDHVHRLIEAVKYHPKFSKIDLTFLYGGSVDVDNISDFLSVPNISGVLIGGASLKPNTFCTIIEKAAQMALTPS